METFRFSLQLPDESSFEERRDALTIVGLIYHYHHSPISVGSSAGGSTLRLGYQVTDDAGGTGVLFEDRVAFQSDLLAPERPYIFQLSIPGHVLRTTGTRLFLDFVYEERFWFHERGWDAFRFRLSPNGLSRGSVAISALNGAEPANADATDGPSDGGVERGKGGDLLAVTAEQYFDKLSPQLLAAVAAAIRAVTARFGARVAVELAYLYLLGRRADPPGLAKKTFDLTVRGSSIEQLCSELLASDEYWARNLRYLRNPDVTIGSWARLDAR